MGVNLVIDDDPVLGLLQLHHRAELVWLAANCFKTVLDRFKFR